MEQQITGQLIHEIARKKEAEKGCQVRAWEEISEASREMYNFVAEQLNQGVVLSLQKQIEERDAVHHNMIGHSEAMFNEQAKEITNLKTEIKVLQALIKDWEAWAAEGMQFDPYDPFAEGFDDLQLRTKHLLREEEVKA